MHFFAFCKASVCERALKLNLCFCQDLVCLFDIYLTPLQKETFLSKEEVKTEKPLNR